MRVAHSGKLLFASLLFLISFLPAYSSNIPKDDSGTEFLSRMEVRTKVLENGLVTFAMEHRNMVDKRQFERYEALYTHKLNKYFSVRAGYLHEMGRRHNDDWFLESPGNWQWKNSNRRSEGTALVGAYARKDLPFLPGKSWLGSLGLEYHYGFFNQHQVLRVRPTLKFFDYEDGKPFMTYLLEYSGYMALNFEETRIYRQYLYLSPLWHAQSQIAIGPTIGWRQDSWVETDAFRARTGRSYENEAESFILGFLLSIRI